MAHLSQKRNSHIRNDIFEDWLMIMIKLKNIVR